MDTFTSDQKMAMLVVPVLLFSMMGISYASAHGRNQEDEEVAVRRTYPQGTLRPSDIKHSLTLKEFQSAKTKEESLPQAPTPLEKSITTKDYGAFVASLSGTAFEESATQEVFDMLVTMYTLHASGKHTEAGAQYKDALL